MIDPDDNDFYEDDDGIGCASCDGGWHHGCMDDLCRGSYGADQCDDATPCRICNPDGEIA
jgi:hypothetical protein